MTGISCGRYARIKYGLPLPSSIALHGTLNFRATEHRLTCGITQCYLPFDTGELSQL